ncbi:hypothetical protein [Gordonia sputi]
MGAIDDWYDDPERTPDTGLPYRIPFTATGVTTPTTEFFDEPQQRLDMSRVPPKNAGLPVDIDVLNILAGGDGLASKPDADAISTSKVTDLRGFVNALLGRLGGDSSALTSWLGSGALPSWLSDFSGFNDLLSQLGALIDGHTSQLADVEAAIANLEEVGAASSTTPAYVADIQDMATIPRSQLTTFAISGSVNSTLIGGHTHSISSGATSTGITMIGSHTHGDNFGVSVQLPVYTPDRLNLSSTSYVDFTPIVVDRAGVVKKLRWIVGADTAIFGIDAYYVALCIYNPSTGAVEKVWDSGNIKDGVANTTNLQEVELDMGIDQHCTPGQVLFFAHQQIAPGVLQGTRSFAAVPQAGISRPPTLLLDACTYRSKTRLGSIPSSIARSDLTRINSRIPWAAVSVDTTEAA